MSTHLDRLHVALWRSYFTPPVPDDDPPGSLLNLLESHRGVIPKPLLGIGLWNRMFKQASAARSEPPNLRDLLRTVLDLSVDGATRLYHEQPASAFPPYPDQVIFDASYERHQYPGGAKATLEICVPREFDRLKRIVNPRHWPEVAPADLFWSRVEAPEWDDIAKEPARLWPVKARLRLPDHGMVDVNLVAKFSTGPFETRMQFELCQNRLMKLCRGQIVVKKELGRPGAVRVISERAVEFIPAQLNQQASGTLNYWLQAETASLVLYA